MGVERSKFCFYQGGAQVECCTKRTTSGFISSEVKWQDFFTVREFEQLFCFLNSLIFLSRISNLKTFLDSLKIKLCADKVYNSIKLFNHFKNTI